MRARYTVCPSRRIRERGIAETRKGDLHRARETRFVSPRRDLQDKGTGPGKARRGGRGPQLKPLTLGLYSHFRNLFIIAAPARAALRTALALRSAEPGPGCGTGRTRRQGRDWLEQALDPERLAERRAAGGRCAGQVRGRKDAQLAARNRPKPAGGRARGKARAGRAAPRGLLTPRTSAGHGRTCADGATSPRPAASGGWGAPSEATNPRPAPLRTPPGTRTQGRRLRTTGPGAHREQSLPGVAR